MAKKSRPDVEQLRTRRLYEQKSALLEPVEQPMKSDPDTEPDWTEECDICGESPIVPCTGMCGPCTFGEADTVGGNW